MQPETLKAEIESHLPTDDQRDAIFLPELEYLLRACPGSGKTWTTCRRFLWRVSNWKYPAGGLALLSFTNVAVREFKMATMKIGRTALDEPHFVGTFDSFVERFIMAPFGHLIIGTKKKPRVFLLPRKGDLANRKLTLLVRTANNKTVPVPAWEIEPRVKDKKLVLVGNAGYQEVPLEQQKALEAMNALLARGEYSHIQRGFWACRLLRKIPSLSKVIAARFPEIIVDEAQDTGSWLLYVLHHLRDAGSKITLVGDPDQCIYEFGLANFESLDSCKKAWNLLEKPLNKSFRCNDSIANAVRAISGNAKFQGRGPRHSEHEGAYIIGDSTESFAIAISAFRKKAVECGLDKSQCAILCRAKEQLARVRGQVRYNELKGKTREMAEAAFRRDNLGDYAGVMKTTTEVLRGITEDWQIWTEIDEYPDGEVSKQCHNLIWKFVRSNAGLPSVNVGATAWVTLLKERLGNLFVAMEMENPPNLNLIFKRTGIANEELELPLFDADQLFPEFRFDTIHKAKGETIGGVLVLGGKKFFDGVVKDVIEHHETENKRLAYVAMTRAKHLLMIGVPATHLKLHEAFWKKCGFGIVQ